MRIAIIGAGNVGSALATSISRAGHEVTITAEDADGARSVAEEVGGTVAESNADAARDADIVILATPYQALREVAEEIRGVVSGKVVIGVANPMKPDLSGLATEGTSAAEELQQLLPDAKVVKAFNTILARNQANPRREIDGFFAGDDADAKARVGELIDSIGFTPLDVGPLSFARYLEGMAFLNISLNATNGWDWSSYWRLVR